MDGIWSSGSSDRSFYMASVQAADSGSQRISDEFM